MRTDPARIAAVALGGALGSVARWAVQRQWPTRFDQFPTTTLAINLVGAFLLGLVIAGLLERPPSRLVSHALLGTGALGGFTTFSTMAVEAVVLVDAGRVWTAGLYLAVSLVLGVVAGAAGLGFGRRLWVPQ